MSIDTSSLVVNRPKVAENTFAGLLKRQMNASQNSTNGHSQSSILGIFCFYAHPKATRGEKASLHASPVGTASMKQNFKPE